MADIPSYRQGESGDHCTTPRSAIIPLVAKLPPALKSKRGCDPYYHNGKVARYYTEAGLNVSHEPCNFLRMSYGEYVIGSPPFSKLPSVLTLLYQANVPWALLVPGDILARNYFQDLFFISNPETEGKYFPGQVLHFCRRVDCEDRQLACKRGCGKDLVWVCHGIELIGGTHQLLDNRTGF